MTQRILTTKLIPSARFNSYTRGAVVTAATLAVLLLAGCADEEPVDFSGETREGFLAACSRPLEDPQLLNDVCNCAFVASSAEIEIERFAEIEQSLKEDDEAELPPEIVDIVARCFIEEAEL